MIDETPSDAALPEARLDEGSAQLRSTVGTRHYRRKAGEDAVVFGDDAAAGRNLLHR